MLSALYQHSRWWFLDELEGINEQVNLGKSKLSLQWLESRRQQSTQWTSNRQLE